MYVYICVDRCVRAVQVKETSSWKRPWPLSINTRWDVGSAGDVDWKPTWSYRPRATPPSFLPPCPVVYFLVSDFSSWFSLFVLPVGWWVNPFRFFFFTVKLDSRSSFISFLLLEVLTKKNIKSFSLKIDWTFKMWILLKSFNLSF